MQHPHHMVKPVMSNSQPRDSRTSLPPPPPQMYPMPPHMQHMSSMPMQYPPPQMGGYPMYGGPPSQMQMQMQMPPQYMQQQQPQQMQDPTSVIKAMLFSQQRGESQQSYQPPMQMPNMQGDQWRQTPSHSMQGYGNPFASQQQHQPQQQQPVRYCEDLEAQFSSSGPDSRLDVSSLVDDTADMLNAQTFELDIEKLINDPYSPHATPTRAMPVITDPQFSSLSTTSTSAYGRAPSSTLSQSQSQQALQSLPQHLLQQPHLSSSQPQTYQPVMMSAIERVMAESAIRDGSSGTSNGTSSSMGTTSGNSVMGPRGLLPDPQVLMPPMPQKGLLPTPPNALPHPSQRSQMGSQHSLRSIPPSLISIQQQQQQQQQQPMMYLSKSGSFSSAGSNPPTYVTVPQASTLKEQPPPGCLEKLTLDMERTLATVEPLPEEVYAREELLTRLRNIVAEKWPDAQLHLYGSSANGFAMRGADLDLCFVVSEEGTTKSEIVETLGAWLVEHDFEDVVVLGKARVPVVKFNDPKTDIECDICINNILALENTRLLQAYCSIDPRLRALGLCIKYWAKKRAVNNPYHGTLSSYAYILLAIHFLQTRSPAILPCLQDTSVTPKNMVGEWDCTYVRDVRQYQGFGSMNNASIGRLFFDFMKLYARDFAYRRSVVSVRAGSFLEKSDKGWTTKTGRDRHLFCIEDPFEVTHDLGRIADRYTLQSMREEFKRAYGLLLKGDGWEEICEAYKSGAKSKADTESDGGADDDN